MKCAFVLLQFVIHQKPFAWSCVFLCGAVQSSAFGRLACQPRAQSFDTDMRLECVPKGGARIQAFFELEGGSRSLSFL
jgi:hypothetical protein